MTKTDDVLLALNRTVARYLMGVSPLQYKNKTYRLIDNYVAVPYRKCDACGDYPIYEVSVIESEEGKTLRMGNDCIDRLTGQSVSEWFRSFRRKRESAMANRKTLTNNHYCLALRHTSVCPISVPLFFKTSDIYMKGPIHIRANVS